MEMLKVSAIFRTKQTRVTVNSLLSLFQGPYRYHMNLGYIIFISLTHSLYTGTRQSVDFKDP